VKFSEGRLILLCDWDRGKKIHCLSLSGWRPVIFGKQDLLSILAPVLAARPNKTELFPLESRFSPEKLSILTLLL
jgi:hypothetical protein